MGCHAPRSGGKAPEDKRNGKVFILKQKHSGGGGGVKAKSVLVSLRLGTSEEIWLWLDNAEVVEKESSRVHHSLSGDLYRGGGCRVSGSSLASSL